MLTVIADRDSVAMGDDVVAHLVAMTFDDDARIGDIVTRMFDDGFLAHVAGPVAWTVVLRHGAEVRRGADGAPESIVHGSGRSADFAMLFVTPATIGGDEIAVGQLSRLASGRSRIREAIEPNGAGEFVVEVRYLSHGGLVPLARYRAWVRKSDAEIEAELEARRARQHPRLDDERGSPRGR